MSQRTVWNEAAHERGVEGFYTAAKTDSYKEYHNGYLNFGLWTRPEMTYEEAAENLVETMGSLLELNAESRVLDIGFGMGTQDLYLTSRFHPKSIEGIDVTWKHVNIANERAKENNIPESTLHFQHGTAVELPFLDGHFNRVLSVEAPEHFDTREKFFHEAFRVLQPGGVLVFSDYPLARQPKNFIDKFFVMLARKIWHVPVANLYGPDVFKEKLLAAGFTDIKIDLVGKLTIPPYVHESTRLRSWKTMIKGHGFWRGVVGNFAINYGLLAVYAMGLCEYSIVRARKI